MALKKRLTKTFQGKQKKITPAHKKCKKCGIKYLGNEDKFYRNMQSLCLKCNSSNNKERINRIKKRNIWNL